MEASRLSRSLAASPGSLRSLVGVRDSLPTAPTIAYWVLRPSLPRQGLHRLRPAAEPRRLSNQTFASALYPVWSADGTKLLFVGARNPEDLPADAFDWWVAPGLAARRSRQEPSTYCERQGSSGGALSAGRCTCRLARRSRFLFWWSDDHTNLWRITVPTVRQSEWVSTKLTSGTSVERKPSVLAGNQFVRKSQARSQHLESFDRRKQRHGGGDVQQVTGSRFDAHTSVSADGKKLVFVSARLGNPDVWMKDLVSGKETALTATPVGRSPEITADGTRVCLHGRRGIEVAVYQIAATGGLAEKICDDCGRPWDWSPDGTKILYLIFEGRRGPNAALGLIDIATRTQTDYIVSPTYNIARVRFSPDARWISFSAITRQPTATDVAGTRVVVAPFRPGAPPREEEWISITPHRAFSQDKSRWSPDGNLLYFVSDVDGFRCIWAQRLEPITKRPVGDPLEVHHSHSARRSLMNVRIPLFFELSLTADRLFFNMSETTGNIWMAEWPRPR